MYYKEVNAFVFYCKKKKVICKEIFCALLQKYPGEIHTIQCSKNRYKMLYQFKSTENSNLSFRDANKLLIQILYGNIELVKSLIT